MTERETDELHMLRAFHECWLELHRIRVDTQGSQDKLTRMRLESAAQRLVEASDTLEAFKAPLNG